MNEVDGIVRYFTAAKHAQETSHRILIRASERMAGRQLGKEQSPERAGDGRRHWVGITRSRSLSTSHRGLDYTTNCKRISAKLSTSRGLCPRPLPDAFIATRLTESVISPLRLTSNPRSAPHHTQVHSHHIEHSFAIPVKGGHPSKAL